MEPNAKDQPYSLSVDSSSLEIFLDICASSVPLWLAVLVGLLVGWFWKPRWVSLLVLGIKSRPRLLWTSPPGFGARRIWMAMTAYTAFQVMQECWVKFRAWRWPKVQVASSVQESVSSPSPQTVECENKVTSNLAGSVVGEDDLRDLQRRFHGTDDGLPWDLMMERSAPGMSYQAWRRDQQQRGPTEYRSRTVFEDASAETVKDFYWDDEFRHVWDDMLIFTKTLEGCDETGAEIAHWVRKFPFFCSDREYLIGRRIFECEGTFFCVTKGVPYAAVPRQSKPRRVDVYYSSWCVRAVESAKKNGQMTACEVTFFHSEDMGIPKEIAKFGVRQGMWGCVRKMEPGLRKYQAYRASTKQLSLSARMAQIITRVPSTVSEPELGSGADTLTEGVPSFKSGNRPQRTGWKWLVVGGAVVLASGLDRGILGKVLVVGVARQVCKLGRRI